jgi:putative membrane protein
MGSLSLQMMDHIALMNIVAPVSAIAVVRAQDTNLTAMARSWLWPAVSLHMLLLWIWHAPPMHAAAASSRVAQVGMLAMLFLAALAFWVAVLSSTGQSIWQAVLALLITGKLACLLGALLVFAPRMLYSTHAFGHASIDDQQLAGLLMIAACPLSYVLVGVILTAQAIGALPSARQASHSAGR